MIMKAFDGPLEIDLNNTMKLREVENITVGKRLQTLLKCTIYKTQKPRFQDRVFFLDCNGIENLLSSRYEHYKTIQECI